MATEIIVVVEDENARGRSGGAAVEERGCQAADATPDDDEVVVFLDRQPLESENFASPRLRVYDLIGARVLSAQSGERRRIAGGLRCDLGRRGEAGSDGEGYSVEEVAPRNRGHALAKWECARELDRGQRQRIAPAWCRQVL